MKKRASKVKRTVRTTGLNGKTEREGLVRELVGVTGRRGSMLRRGVSESVKKEFSGDSMGNQGIWVGIFLRKLQSRHTGPDMLRGRPLLSPPRSDANSGEKDGEGGCGGRCAVGGGNRNEKPVIQ